MEGCDAGQQRFMASLFCEEKLVWLVWSGRALMRSAAGKGVSERCGLRARCCDLRLSLFSSVCVAEREVGVEMGLDVRVTGVRMP